MATFDVNVLDNQINQALKEEVWEYINNQVYYASYKKPPGPDTYTYIPSEGSFMKSSHLILSARQPTMWMHRACLASDDASLEKNHPVIWKLWQSINQVLGDKYIIEGYPEDVFTGHGSRGLRGSASPLDPQWIAPKTQNPKLEQGWRVYVNGQPDETIKWSHGIHKDTIDLNNDQTRTILYIANLEWYPTWFGECIFYPDDDNNTAGDQQQYQKNYGQSRNFNVGWADNGKIVSPVPGRIIDYDGRTLHTTRPTAVWCPDIRKAIGFRVRTKT